MKTKSVPLRIPELIDELAAICGKEQHIDKAAALRQWLYRGAEDYVLKLLSEARISIGRAAEILDTSIYDIHRMAEARGIELGATDEQRQESRKVAAQLIARAKR
jgi:hypothetical protein